MSGRILQITAGTGPIEVRRFVALLADHLADRCALRGAAISDVAIRGDELNPASVEIHFAMALPSIESLVGTHALIARSPDRGKRARKRWYAGVTLSDAASASPLKGASPSLTIERGDVVITAMRSGGPGGQHVNKTSSAVRVFHPPSGITVRVSDERSQRDNIRAALLRIEALIAERAAEEASGAVASRRLRHYRVERGRPAFTYELDRNGGLCLCDETCSK